MEKIDRVLKPTIRQEIPSDYGIVYEVVKEAFASAEYADGDEQDLVVKLRNSDAFIPELSLVAEVEGRVVGHVILTIIHIGEGAEVVKSLTLAPVSVLPEFQNQGLGSLLIREVHRLAVEMGFGSVVVIGHPEYYPRFGYQKASKYGLTFKFEVPDDVAMVIELWPGALNGVSGLVRLSKAFGPLYT